MLVRTKNSIYEFDTTIGAFRKIHPILGPWSIYVGLVGEPVVGERLEIVQDTNESLITSVVIEVTDDD